MMVAPAPIMRADETSTNPEAGVMATNPATAPVIIPKPVGRPLRMSSINDQVKPARQRQRALPRKLEQHIHLQQLRYRR